MNEWLHKLTIRLPALVLLLVSLLFWGSYDRYELAGPVLLESPSLAEAIRVRGDCTETNGRFVLHVPEGGPTANLNFPIPGGAGYERMRVSGRIKTDGVVEGRHGWSCARLLLAQYDADGEWMPGHHTLQSESGSTDWNSHDNVFEIMPEAARVDVVIQQIGRSGTAEFDQLVAEPVRLRSSFTKWRILFAVLWISMAPFFFRQCRMHRRKLRVLILLNALAILAGAMMPEKWIEGATDRLKEPAAWTHGNGHDRPSEKTAAESENKTVDVLNAAVGTIHQTGHFLLFASLCFLVYLSAALERQHRIYFLKVAFDVLLFAAITESLQYLTVDRTPGIADWMTDLHGMAAAFLLFLAVLGTRGLVLRLGRGFGQ